MLKFAVPYDEDDHGDTDVWHRLTAALQQFRHSSSSGGGEVSSPQMKHR